MALFLDQIEDSTLIRTVVLPKKTNRVDTGTTLYIPAHDFKTLSSVVDKIRSPRSNFKFKLPKSVYMPARLTGKLGSAPLIYKNSTAPKDIKRWKALNFHNLATTELQLKEYNGIVDYTDFMQKEVANKTFKRTNIHTLWEVLLHNVNPSNLALLVWTPQNVSRHILSASALDVNDWKNSDLYINFLWQVRYNWDVIRPILIKNNTKIIWTDYKYTFYVDPSDPKYDKIKPRYVINEWLPGLRKVKLNNLVIELPEETTEEPKEVEDTSATKLIKSVNIKNQYVEESIVEEEEPKLTEDEVLKEKVDSLTIESGIEFSDELINSLRAISTDKKKTSYDNEVNNILNIIDKSKKKIDYIPNALQDKMSNKQSSIVDIGIADTLKNIETDLQNVIESKKYEVNGNLFDTFRIKDMNRQYKDKKAKEDRLNILSSLSQGEKPLFLTNYKEVKDNTVADANLRKISVTYSTPDSDKNTHTFTFSLPELRDDKFLYLGNSDKIMMRQKISLPIIRLQNEVVFTTYYNKMFVRLSSGNVNRKVYKIKKFIKAMRKAYSAKAITWLTFTPTVEFAMKNNHYSEEILEVTRFISEIHVDAGNYMSLSGKDNKVGEINGESFYTYGTDDFIYNEDKSTKYDIIKFIDTLIYLKHDEKIRSIWKASIAGKGTNSIMYSYCTAAHAKLPVFYVIMHALDYNLHTLLERLKQEYDLEYTIIPDDTKVRKVEEVDEEDDIKFDGFTLRLRYNNLENRVLLSKLLSDNYTGCKSLNVQEVVEPVFTTMGKVNLANLRDLFIDPISKEVMESIGVPSDYVGALIYANALLFKYDRPVSEISLKYERMPSNEEIIQGALYKVISHEYADYVKKLKFGVSADRAKFSIPPDAVIKILQESPSVAESSKLNPVSHVYNMLSVSNKGLEGLGINGDRAYTINKRLWDETFYGIMSDVSPYSENTGKNRQLAVNPNITDIRGFFNEKPQDLSELNASETMSVSEGLGTFTQAHDASPRTAMGMSQFNHLMPTLGSEPSLVTYGFDESLSYLDTDFVFRAKGNGVIKAISKDFIKVKYDDPNIGEETYAIDSIVRNSEKAFYIPNRMQISSSIKVGQRVNEDTLLAYNTTVYEEFDEGIPIFKSGPIVNVAIAHTQYSYEDSALISQNLANRLGSKVIKRVAVKLTSSDRIGQYAKINNKEMINAGDVLIKFLESDGTSLNGLFGDAEISLSDVLAKTTISHYQGYLRDIYVYTKLDEKSKKKMDNSIKKFINYVTEYYDANQSTGKFRVERVSENNRNVEHVIHYPVSKKVKVNNSTLYKGDILVEFFIEIDQSFTSGDKITFGNTALKGVCSKVLPDELRPHGVKTNKVVDAVLSPISPLARMVYSFFLNGVLSECVRKANEDILDIINKS